MRPSVSSSYENVLHNYFVRHNSLIFIFVRFFIAALEYDGHEGLLDSYVIKLYRAYIYVASFAILFGLPVRPDFSVFEGL